MLRVATTCAVSAECKQRAFEAWLVWNLGRAVKAIDSKSIGVTRVSSSLTAVDLIDLCVLVVLATSGPTGASRCVFVTLAREADRVGASLSTGSDVAGGHDLCGVGRV
ncbi:hypothetical protein PC114_g16410 [Phytophthora cactorum]|nr:hypothetical protein PC114_g16410 [Phytophthora cactorum]